MLSAINLDKTYHGQIDMILCDRKRNICMINMINCYKFFPGISDAKKHLKEQCQLTGERNKVSSNMDENRTRDFDEEEEESTITFKQWVSIDHVSPFLCNDYQ